MSHLRGRKKRHAPPGVQTPKKSVEEELAGPLLSSANTIVLCLDMKGEATFVNRALEEVSGYSKAEIIAAGGLKAMVAEELRQVLEDYLDSVLEGAGAHTPVIIPILTKSGEEREISWTFCPLGGAGGVRAGALGVGQDVTERRAGGREAVRRTRELELVNRILAEAGAASDLSEILERGLDALLSLTGYRTGAAYLIKGGEPRVELVCQRGFVMDIPTVDEMIEGVFPATALETGEVVIAGPGTKMHPSAAGVMEKEGLSGAVAIPVFSRGVPLGAVLVGHNLEGAKVEDDRGVFEAAAEAIRLCADNASLRAQAEERAREAAALLRVSQRIAGAPDIESILEAIVKEAAELLQVDRSGIYIYDEAKGVLRRAAGYGIQDEEMKGMEVTFEEFWTASETRRTLKPVVLADALADPRTYKPLVEKFGIRGFLAAPLVWEDEFKGVVTFSKRVPYGFTAREVELVEIFTRQAAVAMRNAFLLRSLTESEDRYRSLVESAEDIIFNMDTEGNITFMSGSVTAVLGYDTAEIVGMKGDEMVPPGRRGEVGGWNSALLEGRRLKIPDLRVPAKDGREVLLDVLLSPRVTGGRVVGVTGIARDVTERHGALEALRESEERYRTLVDSSLLGILVHDGVDVLYLNDRAAEISGYPKEYFKKMDQVLDLLVPEERPKITEVMEKRLAGEDAPMAYDTKVRRRDGSIAVVQVMSTLTTMGGKNVVIVELADVTKRVKAEEAVRASEERYRALVESSRDAILIVDPRGRVLFANPSSATLTKVPLPEIIGQNIYNIVHPEERDAVTDKFYGAWKRGKGVTRYPTKVLIDGEDRYFDVTSTLLGEPGPSANTMLIVTDVTERERAQRRLRESEERYRTIVEATQDVIVTVNRAGEILFANPAVSTVYGISPEEMRGRNLFRYVDPRDRELMADRLARGFKSGRPVLNAMVKCLREDGSHLHVEMDTELLGWPGEEAVALIVIRDVTERRHREVERELQLKVEEARAATVSRFVDPGDAYEAIRDTLEGTGELLDLSRAYYFEMSADGREVSRVIEWAAEGVERTKDMFTGLTVDEFPWWVEMLSSPGGTAYSDIEEMPGERERELLRQAGVLASAVEPVFLGEKLVGCLCFQDSRSHREWSVHEVNLLRDIANTISRALERRKWVENLERSERFRTRITDSIGEGLVVARETGIAWVNPQAAEMFGYRPEEMVGRRLDFLFPDPESYRGHLEEAEEVLGKDGRFDGELRLMRKDNSAIDVAISIRSLEEKLKPRGEVLVTVADITEAKRMREEIAAAADAYSTIFSAAGDGLIVHAVDGAIRDVNVRTCEYTGYSREELLGVSIEDLVAERYRQRYKPVVEEIMSKGRLVFEVELVRRDGSTFPVEVTARRTNIWGETVILSAQRDITERKKAEEETERRSRQLASLNEIMKASTSSLDLNIVVEQTLMAALEVTGGEKGLVVLETHPGRGELRLVGARGHGPEFLEKMEPAERKRALLELASGRGGAVILDVDEKPDYIDDEALRDLARDGVRSGVVVPIRSGGKTLGALALWSGAGGVFKPDDLGFFDAVGAQIGVSIENSMIYRELSAEHERLSLLYRSAQSVSGQLTLDALLGTVAEQAARAVGAESAVVALVEPAYGELVLRAGYNFDMEGVAGATIPLDSGMSGTAMSGRRAVVVRPGEGRPGFTGGGAAAEVPGIGSGIAVPLVSGDKVVGLIGLGFSKEDWEVRDEDVLLLEAMGRQTGVAIENVELYDETRRHLGALERAHQELMELDRMKSDFVSTVSHELRSPLAVIQGFANTLVENFDRLDEDVKKESLDIILKKAVDLEGLIENVLDMSRIEGGRLEVELEEFDIVELCEEVRADQDRISENHEVVLEGGGGGIDVVADREKAGVAIGNLVRNAVKFSPGGGTVRISVREADGTAEVSVEDRGIGIPVEEQERIFDRFYQVDSGETRAFTGTGLGLYITRELVNAMGGTVWVESRPGEGSKFNISLPLARGGAGAGR